MAAPMLCDGPDGTPSLYVVTNTETADVLAFCAGCFADFAQAYLQAVAPERLATAPKPAARGGRRARATTAPDGAEGGAPDGEPAP